MNKNARLTTWIISGAALGMLGLSFAAEPIYSTFCRITGFGGTTQVAVKPADRVLDQMVRVHFDANVDPAAPLKFTATKPYVDVKLGETVMSFYEVTNLSDGPVKAMAAFNVAPDKAGVYFSKIECFCFKERTFPAGHTEKLPVIFFVSPDLADDPLAKDIKGITLSYTYYRSEGGIQPSARLEDASAVN